MGILSSLPGQISWMSNSWMIRETPALESTVKPWGGFVKGATVISALQKYIPVALLSQVLHLSPVLKLNWNTKEGSMYSRMRQHLYQLNIDSGAFHAVQECNWCTHEVPKGAMNGIRKYWNDCIFCVCYYQHHNIFLETGFGLSKIYLREEVIYKAHIQCLHGQAASLQVRTVLIMHWWLLLGIWIDVMKGQGQQLFWKGLLTICMFTVHKQLTWVYGRRRQTIDSEHNIACHSPNCFNIR